MDNCSMSDCPMDSQKQDIGCHDSTGSREDHGWSSTAAGPQTLIACCDVPVDQEPVQIDAGIAQNHGTTPLMVLAERVDLRPPCKPPDSISQTVSSRQYEMGRCTLLSSFLL